VRLYRAILLLFGLALLENCATKENAFTHVVPTKQTVMDLCLTYGAVPTKGPPLIEVCKTLVGSNGADVPNLYEKSEQTNALTIDALRDQCRETLSEDPESAEYCRRFSEALHQEWQDNATKSPSLLTFILEQNKACIWLADSLPGGAPEMGYCFSDGYKGLLSPVQSGDVNDLSALEMKMKRLFPSGTPVASMSKRLASAGFTCLPDKEEGECTGNMGVLSFHKGQMGAIGGLAWTVHWHADPGGQLDRLDVKLVGASL
jgi:hypothetical protein